MEEWEEWGQVFPFSIDLAGSPARMILLTRG